MHVHVKNGDGKAKINIETAEVIENSGIKPADLKKAWMPLSSIRMT